MTDLTQEPQQPPEPPPAPQVPLLEGSKIPLEDSLPEAKLFDRQPMTNTYAQPSFPNDPVWAAKLQQEKDQADSQVMMRIRKAIKDGDHDAIAEAHRLQLKTGMTLSSIRENASNARGIAAALDARDANYAENNPALYRYLNDPAFAAVAADDRDNLWWYERLGHGIDRGQLMVEQGKLGWKLMHDGLSELEADRLAAITEEMDAFAADDGMWALTGETLGQMGETMPVALGAGALAATAVGAVTGGTGAAPTFMLVSGLVGYNQTAAIEGGLAYLQYKRGGMDLATAATNATIVGRLNGIVEMVPLGAVGSPFVKAGRTFGRRAASKLSRSGVSGAVRRMMAQRTKRRSMKRLAAGWALGTGAEVSAEVVQETVTALGEKWGQAETGVLRKARVGKIPGDFNMPGGGTVRTNADGTVDVSPEIFDLVEGVIPIGSSGRAHRGDTEMRRLDPEAAAQLISELDRIYPLESVLNDETFSEDLIQLVSDTAWSALKGMWLPALGGPIIQHMSERSLVKQSKADHKVFAGNVEQAADSKTNKRSPSAFSRFWQDQAEEGDDAVLISRKEIDEVMQKAEINIDDLEQVFPGVKEQYELPAEIQPDIEIPKGEAVSKFTNNELFDIFKDSLRPNRDALSANQVKTLEKSVEAKSQELQTQLDEEDAVIDERTQQLDTIEQGLFDQLVEAGTTKKEARLQSAWARNHTNLRALRKSESTGQQVMPSEIHLPKIISASVDRTGRQTLQQEVDDDLVAVHRVDSSVLQSALDLGGLPAPSIAITKVDTQFEGFGDINLIGTRDLVDPERGTPVFDVDAYTSRFPRAVFSPVKTAKADKFTKEIREAGKEVGDDHTASLVFEHLVNDPDPSRAASALSHSDAGRALWLKESKPGTKLPMEPRKLRYAWMNDDQLQSWLARRLEGEKDIPADDKLINANPGDPVFTEFSQQVAEAINRYGQRIVEQSDGKLDADDVEFITTSEREAVFDKDGDRLSIGPAHVVLRSFRENLGKERVNRAELEALVDMDAVRDWAEKKTREQFAEGKIQIGRRKVPVTLENVVEAITRDRKVQSREKTLTFGVGQMRAAAANQFRSIEEIRSARDSISSPEVEKESREGREKRLDVWRMGVIEHYEEVDWKGNVDTWNALDDSMRVLAAVAKQKRPTTQSVRGAFRRNNFRGDFPVSIIKETKSLAADIASSPVDYFEAKPQRAVGFNEFAAAAVPEGTPQKLVDALEAQGLVVSTYQEGSRNAVVKKLAEDAGVLFSKQEGVVRGEFDPDSMTIILGKEHNATTFFHEWSHFHLQTLTNEFLNGVATAEDVRDLETIAKWAGYPSAEEFATAPIADQRAGHEAWAAAFEVYLYQNKADSVEMRTTMQRIAEWFVRAWRNVKRINENYRRLYGEDLPAMTPEVQAVMDRMMLTDEQIDVRLQQDAIAKMLDGVDVTPEEQARLDKLYFDHESKSKEELRRRFVRQLRKLRSFRGRELKKLQKDSRRARSEAEERASDSLLRDRPEARLVHWLDSGEVIEIAADGELVVRQALADPARIATTDPRVPKKWRTISPALAEDMQLDAELELVETTEKRDKQKVSLDARIESLRESIKRDTELRKAVKKELKLARKAKNEALIVENEDAIDAAETRIANSKDSIAFAKEELRDWNREVKKAEADVREAKAITMRATDPARQEDDGVAPLFLAEKFGFSSADAVLEGSMFNFDEEKHQIADELMGEEFPELATQEAMAMAVSEAVNNEALLRARTEELRILDKQSPGQNVILATARLVAKRVVANRLVKELTVQADDTPVQMGQRRGIAHGLGRKFELAAKQAERTARAARDAQNLEEMQAQQRVAVQQRALSAEAYTQRDKLRKQGDRLHSILRFTGAKREQQLARSYGGETVETARMMLDAIGLGRGSRHDVDGTYDPLAQSKMSDSQQAELRVALAGAREVGRQVDGNFREMPIGGFGDFLLGVEGVLNLGRRMRLIQKGDTQLVMEELVEELQAQADKEGRSKPNKQQDNTSKKRRVLGGINEAWQRMESLLYAMDGGKQGTLTKVIWQPIAEAAERLNEDEVKVLSKFKEIVRPLRDEVRENRKLAQPMIAKHLIDPETGEAFEFLQGKLGIIGALIHSGSDSNLRRLIDGWGWGSIDPETDVLNREAWDQQVREWEADGTVTESDWKAVQAIWDLYDEMLPAMQRAHMDAMGFDMELTQRMPVATAWGTLKGGYVPAAKDQRKQKTKTRARDANDLLSAQREMPVVRRGMTQSRVDHKFEPLELDLLKQIEHFHKHLLFTHLAAPVKQLEAIVYQEDVNASLERLYPGFSENHLKHWMETVSTQSSTLGQTQNIDGASNLWNALRRNTGTAAMMGNVRNAIQNIGGIAAAAARVRPRYLMLGFYDYISQRGSARDEINKKSRMMRLRHTAGNNIYEVRDAINELHESANVMIRNVEATRKFLSKHTYILQELTQKPLDRIVWLGAYRQAIDEGKNETDSVRAADGAVRMTQHDSTAISLARGEKGTPLVKLASQFMGWFAMLASLRGGDFHNMSRSQALLLVTGPMLTTLVIGEILSEMIDDHEEEDAGWDKSALRIAANSVFALPRAFGPIGAIASTALNSSIGAALGTAESYQMRMPEPAANALIGRALRSGRQWVESMVSEEQSRRRKAVGNSTVDFLELIGAAFGIPIGVLTNRTQAGLTDEEADLMGLITGR